MKRALLVLVCLLMVGCPAPPTRTFGTNQPVVEGELVFISDQRITALAAATALTVPANTKVIWIFAEGQNLRMRHGVPTAAIGVQIAAGDHIENYTASLDTLQFIEEAVGGIVFVNYYRYAP